MKSVDRESSAIMLVRDETCPKISERAAGLLGYRVCIAADESEVFLAITSNETSGYFSREYVPVSRIEAVIKEALQVAKAFPASRLKTAFDGKSVNNASFLAAILRKEGLVVAAPDSPMLNVPSMDMIVWRKEVLKQPRTTIAVVATSAPADDAVVKDEPAKAKGMKHGKKKPKADAAPEADPAWVETVPEAVSLMGEGQDDLSKETQ